MKKILVSLVLFVLFLCSFSICNANASSSDAVVRGYKISDNWTYVDDTTFNFKEVHGSTYYQGKMDSWMGIYKHLDETTNEMFVLVMCTGRMQPNQNSYWDQYRWNNQEMRIEIYPEINDTSMINLVTYGPQTSEGSVSWGISGGISGLDISLQISQSYTSPEVKVNTKLLDNQDNGIKIIHSFEKYNSNKNLDSPCCDLVTKNNFAIFKIKNFDRKKDYTFNVDFYATFYRYGYFNSSSVSDSMKQKFTIFATDIPPHVHSFTYKANKDGMTHIAKCLCGETITEPCLGYAELGGIAQCAKCHRFMKQA